VFVSKMENTLKKLVANSQSSPDAMETRRRLERCWTTDVNWDLYPKKLSDVS